MDFILLIYVILTLFNFVNAEDKVLLLSDNGHLYYKKTFHMAVSYKLGGRLNFKPTVYSTGDQADLSIRPDFTDGTYDIELISKDAESNCDLSYHDQGVYEIPPLPLINSSFSRSCSWPRHKLKPGHWYRFNIWRSGKSLVNKWQVVEPAFDPDALGVTVLPTASSINVQLDVAKAGRLWNDLIGQEGEILVNLMDGDKVIQKSIKSGNHEHETPGVLFSDVSPGHCYTIEVMSSSRNVLSFNRTWFHVRPSPANFSLVSEGVTKDSVRLSIKPIPNDSSCTAILTLIEAHSEDRMPRYVFLGNEHTALIKGLNSGRHYTVKGISQCGSLADLCRLQKMAIQPLEFDTL